MQETAGYDINGTEFLKIEELNSSLLKELAERRKLILELIKSERELQKIRYRGAFGLIRKAFCMLGEYGQLELSENEIAKQIYMEINAIYKLEGQLYCESQRILASNFIDLLRYWANGKLSLSQREELMHIFKIYVRKKFWNYKTNREAFKRFFEQRVYEAKLEKAKEKLEKMETETQQISGEKKLSEEELQELKKELQMKVEIRKASMEIKDRKARIEEIRRIKRKYNEMWLEILERNGW